MTRKFSLAIAGATCALCCAVSVPETDAAPAGIDVGVLSCSVGSGWGFVLGSSRPVSCTYSPQSGVVEHYVGQIAKYGVDLGYLSNATIVWTVVMPTIDLAPGSLAGAYGGVTGGASVGIGAGANVMIGGSTRSISLEPVSVEAEQGFDVAGGLTSLTLHFQS